MTGLLALIGGWAAVAPSPPAATCGPPPHLSPSALRAALLDGVGRVTSIRIDYRVPYPAEGTAPATGVYAHRTFAAKPPGFLFLDISHGSDRRGWESDPTRQRVYVDGRRMLWDWVATRTYEEEATTDAAPLKPKMLGDLYVIASGWWPPGYRRSPPRAAGEQPIVLADVAARADYVVRPQQEVRDGRWCHVLERAGVDALWLDADRGCVPVRRIVWDPDRRVKKQEFRLTRHEEVSPGVWIPTRIEHLDFDYRSDRAEDRDRPRGRTEAVVESVSVNDVSDDLFTFHPAPGAMRMNRHTGDCEQTAPGGLDYLSAVAQSARETLPPRAQAPPEGPSVGWLAGALPLLGWVVFGRRRPTIRATPVGRSGSSCEAAR